MKGHARNNHAGAELELHRIVNYLVSFDPSRLDRNFMHPAPGQTARCSATRQLVAWLHVLDPLRGRLKPWADPVALACSAINAKIKKHPDEMWQSTQLYRAIEDLELAMTLPAFLPDAVKLRVVVDELRVSSGWSERD